MEKKIVTSGKEGRRMKRTNRTKRKKRKENKKENRVSIMLENTKIDRAVGRGVGEGEGGTASKEGRRINSEKRRRKKRRIGEQN